MQRYAHVKNGVVFNITLANESFAATRTHMILCDETTRIGDLWDGTTFSRPPRDMHAEREVFQNEIRKLLRASDWTQIDGTAGQEKANWMQYRAALRAALRNPTIDPQTFDWPVAPGELNET